MPCTSDPVSGVSAITEAELHVPISPSGYSWWSPHRFAPGLYALTDREEEMVAACEERGPRSGLGVAGGAGGHFDDGIGELAHGSDEHLDDGPVKLSVGAALEFGEGFRRTAAFLVRGVAGDGVVGIGHGDDARAERNAFAGESIGITGAIEEFVMMENHLANARERNEGVQNLCSKFPVGLHGFPLFGIERTALVQNSLRDGYFADVVEHATESNLLNLCIAHVERLGDEGGVGGDLL